MEPSKRNSLPRRESYRRRSISRASLILDWPWINTGFDNDLEGTITALPALPKSRPSSKITPTADPASITASKSDLQTVSEAPVIPVTIGTGNGRPPGPPGGWLSENMSPSQEAAFNVMVCLVQLIPQACLTTCFPIIRILTHSLHIHDPAVLPWVVAAYAISFGTTILLAGRIGDIFGHRNMVILGFCWLAAFSVLAAASHYLTYEVFFVARAMQGVGSAMMNPNALALLGRSYPPGSKGKILAFSAFGLCAPLGAYFGMLGGAVLGQLVHWTWCFYVLAIASALLAFAAVFALPKPMKTPKQMLPFRQKLSQMDWLGGITGVCGLVAIQVALISAPVQSWKTQYIFMLLIIGLLLVVFFVIIELKVSKEPLVPFRLLNGNVAFVLAAIACGWGTFGVWTYYLWRFLLLVRRYSPLDAALHVLPIVPVAIIAAAITAVLMRTTKPAWILLWALVAFTLGPTFLAVNPPHTTYWSFMFVSLIVTPFGMDMSFPSATFIMSNSLPMDKQGVAGSLVTTVVNYSISLGLGLASTVEVHVNNHGKDMLQGLRGGWFMGVGLGCLGIVVCTAFVLKTMLATAKEVVPVTTVQSQSTLLETHVGSEKGIVDDLKVSSPPVALTRERPTIVNIPRRPSVSRIGSFRSSQRGSWSGRSTILPDSIQESLEVFHRSENQPSDEGKERLISDSSRGRAAASRAGVDREMRRQNSRVFRRFAVRSEAQRQRDMEPSLRIVETWEEGDEMPSSRPNPQREVSKDSALS